MRSPFWFQFNEYRVKPTGSLAQQQNVNIFRASRQLLYAFFVNIPWCHFINPEKEKPE